MLFQTDKAEDQVDTDQVIAPLCKDCKHLIGVRWKEETAQTWKCAHPENHANWFTNLVTGIQERVVKYPIDYLRHGPWDILHTVCGADGKWFELYTPPPAFDIVNTIGGQEGAEIAFDDAALEASKAAAKARLDALKARKKT